MRRCSHGLGALLLALLLTLIAGCGESVPRLPHLGTQDVIVAFGDSLTYGTGASEDESYPAVLARLINRPVVRAGVPGEVTAQGLRRLPSVINTYQPHLVIVCLGGNDMLRKVGEGEIERNLRNMLKLLSQRGIAAVLVGVPKPALIARAPGFYADLAREFEVPYEGEILTSVLLAADMKSDPIHPNAKGYRKMAEALARLLREAGAL